MEKARTDAGEYPKLVRDLIPENLAARGIATVTRDITEPDERLHYLTRKLMEEAHELHNAESDTQMQEELADVMEALDGILNLKAFSLRDIMDIKASKRVVKGAFNEGILMLQEPKDPTAKG